MIIVTVVAIIVSVVAIIVSVVVIIVSVVVTDLDSFNYFSSIIILCSFSILSDNRPSDVVDYDFDFLTCCRVPFNF